MCQLIPETRGKLLQPTQLPFTWRSFKIQALATDDIIVSEAAFSMNVVRRPQCSAAAEQVETRGPRGRTAALPSSLRPSTDVAASCELAA